MSSTADKARSNLEQSVPQLQELLRKKVFTEAELKSISRKRSDFEHTINARDHSGSDYASYAAFEANLAALMRKRAARLKVKLGMSSYEEPRKIFFILERGVRRFPGDLALWMQLIEFARKEKARKKLKELFTRLLRLHPTKWELWVRAAKYMLEDEADMMGARSYLQRGLRFCQRQKSLWVEFARLECLHVARVAARRKILGLNDTRKSEKAAEKSVSGAGFGEDADEVTLPTVTEEDINPSVLAKDAAVDEVALQNLEKTPALTGAIPMAVFDAAMKEFGNDDELGLAIFDMVAEFERSDAFDKILRHIVERLSTTTPDGVHSLTAQFMLPIVGLEISSPSFPNAIAESLHMIRHTVERLPLVKKDVACAVLARLLPIVCQAGLDADVKTALAASLRKYVKFIENVDDAASLINEFRGNKQIKEARLVLQAVLKACPEDQKLLASKIEWQAEKRRRRLPTSTR